MQLFNGQLEQPLNSHFLYKEIKGTMMLQLYLYIFKIGPDHLWIYLWSL